MINAHGVDLEVYRNLYKDVYGVVPRGDADAITKADFDVVAAACSDLVASLPAE